MFTRKEFEEIELEYLASYAMKSRQSRGRKYHEEEHLYRTCFQRDRDRVIHSSAFRRLEYKTQVFVNHEGDYYRTRLTHTLEVAQVARSIARALRLNEDLTEAIALAHDLGHTPFGHSGEEALHNLMREYGESFEHNRQGLRVVDELEKKYPGFPGLNLSWEVREGIIKHKTPYDQPDVKEFNPDESPTLESQVVNIADEIAYTNHDLDDGFTAGYINEDELSDISLWKEIYGIVKKENPLLNRETWKFQAAKFLINKQVSDLITNTDKNLAQFKIKDIEDVRKAPIIVQFSAQMEEENACLKKFLLEHLYHHHKVLRMVDKSRRFIKELFRVYIKFPEQLPPDVQERIKNVNVSKGSPEEKSEIARIICDYIAGMTDRSVQDEYIKLFMPYEKV
ncbi:deoxyguanosinetriphosphate triphosphohydrolase [Candidatus Desantisbacteria bacterium CG1_02_38_46]|uniref:Deoxyguanosinetriphosphate triphosphohydrolase-like protein n=1 Tax=Candidatus Desantisbacteria bacterium CG1_02_38_46 TaxID=1817893 RepID=A0A1J4SI04_9BACT|nr:MAG: deoxyguanosinetriphosphate triphosphohydrolase [Candidatus Desantisbacteria bacterium CG1_02_38_46]